MKLGLERWLGHIREVGIFLKWLLYACGIGLLAGAVAAAFHFGIDWATELRGEYPWVVWLAPIGGVAIVLLYRVCHMEKDQGTNLVLVAVREAEPLKLRTAPLIFLSTILTHLVGGSAGREGAALQLGGSLAAWVGRNIGLDDKDRRVMVMCGMAAAFSALFGTPLTAAVFAMEVVSVGVMYYAALVPCAVASSVAFLLARFLGLHQTLGYPVGEAPGPYPFDHAPGGGTGSAVRPDVHFVLQEHALPLPSSIPGCCPIPWPGRPWAACWCCCSPCWWGSRPTTEREMRSSAPCWPGRPSRRPFC